MFDLFCRHDGTRRRYVPPEMSRRADEVQRVFDVLDGGEFRQDVFADVVSSSQAGKRGSEDYDVTGFRHRVDGDNVQAFLRFSLS